EVAGSNPAPATEKGPGNRAFRGFIGASLDSRVVFDYAERQGRLAGRMEAEGVDVLFLAPAADLAYLTGGDRQIPNFGEASYPSGWVTGATTAAKMTRRRAFTVCGLVPRFGGGSGPSGPRTQDRPPTGATPPSHGAYDAGWREVGLP